MGDTRRCDHQSPAATQKDVPCSNLACADMGGSRRMVRGVGRPWGQASHSTIFRTRRPAGSLDEVIRFNPSRPCRPSSHVVCGQASIGAAPGRPWRVAARNSRPRLQPHKRSVWPHRSARARRFRGLLRYNHRVVTATTKRTPQLVRSFPGAPDVAYHYRPVSNINVAPVGNPRCRR